MPLVVPDRHDRRAPGLPQRRRRVRRVATSAPCGSTAPTPSTRCRGRSPTTSARSRPGRAQYTHLLDEADASVLDDIIVWWIDDERVRRDAERLEHRPGASTPSAATETHRTTAACSPCRARRRAERLATVVAGGGRRRAVPRAAARLAGRRRARSPAPATRARTASRSPCPAERGADAVAGDHRRRGRAGRPRRPRHAAPRGRRCRCTATSSAPASPRCRPGSAGSWRGRKDEFRGRERARGRARPAASPALLRGIATDGRRPPRAELPVLVDGAVVGRGHERQLLAGARPRHRPRLPPPGGGVGSAGDDRRPRQRS